MAERDDDAVTAASEGERDVRLLAQPLTDLHRLSPAEKVWALKILQEATDIIPVVPQTGSQDLNDFLSAVNSLLDDVAGEIDEAPIGEDEDDDSEDEEADDT